LILKGLKIVKFGIYFQQYIVPTSFKNQYIMVVPLSNSMK